MGQVGCEFEHKNVVIQFQVFADANAQRRVWAELEQATMIVVHAQLFGRAQHAAAFYTAQLAHFDFEGLAVFAWGQQCAHLGQRNPYACACIGSPAHDLQRLALPRAHLAHAQAIGIGVLFGTENFGHDHTRKGRRNRIEFFDLKPSHGERIGQLLGGEIGVAKFAQPGFRKLHAVPRAQ